MKALANRLKEPSTWATLFAALAAIGISLDPGLMQNITAAGAGLAGLLGFMLPEGKAE